MVRRLSVRLTEDGDDIDILGDDNGDYVDYDDYAALEAREARLRSALRECVEAFGSVFAYSDTGDELGRAMRKAREVLGDD